MAHITKYHAIKVTIEYDEYDYILYSTHSVKLFHLGAM